MYNATANFKQTSAFPGGETLFWGYTVVGVFVAAEELLRVAENGRVQQQEKPVSSFSLPSLHMWTLGQPSSASLTDTSDTPSNQ